MCTCVENKNSSWYTTAEVYSISTVQYSTATIHKWVVASQYQQDVESICVYTMYLSYMLHCTDIELNQISNYKCHPINKLQNGIIQLIFKIRKIFNVHNGSHSDLIVIKLTAGTQE